MPNSLLTTRRVSQNMVAPTDNSPDPFEAEMDAFDDECMFGEWPDLPVCDLENPESCESCQ
jgi:hypothetical protein